MYILYILGGGNSNIFLFSPRKWMNMGEMIQFDGFFFQWVETTN